MNTAYRICWTCLGLLGVLSLGAAAASGQSGGFSIAEARRSVVFIKSFIPNVGTGVGTGFLVDERGLIYTNRHVIESGNRSHRNSVIVVGVPSKEDPDKLDYFRAKVVHAVEEPQARDFAILKIAAKPEYGKFTPLRLAAKPLELGDSVAVLGFPYIQEGEPTISFTKGAISSVRVRFEGISFYQTDAAVNPGNSGGPLLNGAGEAAGIVTLKISEADNIGYALYISEVLPEIEKAKPRIASLEPDRGPLPLGETPDFESLASEDSEAGSGTEARMPDWAVAKPFDPINRIWTGADGSFTVEATYVTSKDDQVTLQKPNGSIVKFALAQLSEQDRYYVRAIESPWKKEGRLPAPPASVVDLKTTEIRDIFEPEFEEGGEALFAKLLKLALESRSQDPAAAYVCLLEASRAAAKAAQIEFLFVTLAGLERWYEIDDRLLPIQTEFLGIAVDAARAAEARAQALDYALRLIDFAQQRRDFDSGARLTDLANDLVRQLQDSEMLRVVRARIKRYEEFEAAFKLSEAARETIAVEPANHKARLTLGRFLTIYANDWSEESLGHLAEGSDERLAAAARLELAGPMTPLSQLALGDAWWDLAAKEDEIGTASLKAHAVEWYRKCYAKLSAVHRTKVDQRMESLLLAGGDDGPRVRAEAWNGLIHHWRFDETEGDIARDSLGRNNVVLSGWGDDSPRWVDGKIGGALEFSEPTSFAITSSEISEDQITATFWLNVKEQKGINPRVIDPLCGLQYYVGKGMGQGYAVADPVKPQLGVWQHYAVAIDFVKRTLTIYRNGAAVASGAPAIGRHRGKLVFGHNANPGQATDSLRGQLDDVRIYGRILTPEEIGEIAGVDLADAAPGQPPTQESLEPKTGAAKGLVHHWKFDETKGDIARDAVGRNNVVMDGWIGDQHRWVEGKFGGALEFSHEQHRGFTAAPIPLDEYTISFWLRVKDLDSINPRIFGPIGGSHNWVCISREFNRGVGFYYDHGRNKIQDPAPPKTGEWEHYAVTVNMIRQMAAVYRNGYEVAAGQFTDKKPRDRWVLGHLGDPNNHRGTLQGQIDDLRVYGRVLGPEDIKQIAGGVDVHSASLSPASLTSLSRWPAFLMKPEQAISIDGDGARLPDATFVRTKAGNYIEKDFVFEVVYRSSEADGLLYFGFGEGLPEPGRGEPTASIKLAVQPPRPDKGDVRLTRGGDGGGQVIGQLRKAGVHRIILEKQGSSLRLAIDVNNDGPSSDDVERSISDFKAFAPFLHEKNTHLFFGGASTFEKVGIREAAKVDPDE